MDPLLVSTSRSFHNTLNEGPLITLMNPRIIPSGSYTWPVAPAASSSLILLAHLRLSPTAHYIPRPFSFETRPVSTLFFDYFVPSPLPASQRHVTLQVQEGDCLVSSPSVISYRVLTRRTAKPSVIRWSTSLITRREESSSPSFSPLPLHAFCYTGYSAWLSVSRDSRESPSWPCS